MGRLGLLDKINAPRYLLLSFLFFFLVLIASRLLRHGINHILTRKPSAFRIAKLFQKKNPPKPGPPC